MLLAQAPMDALCAFPATISVCQPTCSRGQSAGHCLLDYCHAFECNIHFHMMFLDRVYVDGAGPAALVLLGQHAVEQ
jgi:hypothetical protein